MFYKDIIVQIPKKKRIRKNGGPLYVYEIISRKNKEIKKDKIVCVGVAINKNQMNPNEKYYELHKELIENKPLKEQKEFDNQVYLGASLAIRSLANKEGLIDVLNNSFKENTELIISLVEYYLTRRDSAAQLFKYYLRNHYTQLNYIPSEVEISKLFNEKIDHESISKFLTEWMNYRIKNKDFSNKIDIDFDSTNRNISSRNVLTAEYGKAKVDEGLPQINTAYFLDRTSGLPLFFDVYYGSIIDMSHSKIAIDKIKAISKNINGRIVVDRGYFSMQNIEYFNKNGFSFIAMGKDNEVFKSLIDMYPKDIISNPINRVYKTIYGIKFKGKAFVNANKEYNLYLYYNESDVASLISNLQDEIEYCCKFLIGKKDKKGEIKNTYGKRINLTYNEEGIIIEAKPNYEYLKEYKNQLGYFWIISSDDESLKDILKTYRYRDLIEKEIKYSKSLADLDKTFVSNDNCFEAKMLLGFISAIIRSLLIKKVKPYFKQFSSETSQTVLLELEKIKAEEINNSYILQYALTSHQKQILALLDLDINDVYSLIEDLKFCRKITAC